MVRLVASTFTSVDEFPEWRAVAPVDDLDPCRAEEGEVVVAKGNGDDQHLHASLLEGLDEVAGALLGPEPHPWGEERKVDLRIFGEGPLCWDMCFGEEVGADTQLGEEAGRLARYLFCSSES